VVCSISDADGVRAALATARTEGNGDVTALYRPLEVVVAGASSDQIFSLADLEELLSLALDEEALGSLALAVSCEIGGAQHTLAGLDLAAFLELCGAELPGSRLDLRLAASAGEVTAAVAPEQAGVLVLTMDGAPMDGGAAVLIGGESPALIKGVRRLWPDGGLGDPHFEMHNRPPHDQSADIPFTIHIYKNGSLADAATYTTAQLEALALEAPEAVCGGYFGIIGDVDSIGVMGPGGFLDYYEGFRLDYLLTEQVGLTQWSGSAKLYGRDGQLYAEIGDLAYFGQEADHYYSCTPEGGMIRGALPMIAYSKNGAPLLPDHEHESEGYVRYNAIRGRLNALEVEAGLGTVKNHSGPFVACLGNCEQLYGGYQMETAGDCIQLDLYLD